MKYKLMNNFTGELYKGWWHAVKTIIKDMIHYPKCRNIKMLSVGKIDW